MKKRIMRGPKLLGPWRKFENLACETCARAAVWYHHQIGVRCNKCPRPDRDQGAITQPDAFLAGVAVALATMVRTFNNPTAAKEIASTIGLTRRWCEERGNYLDEFDWVVLDTFL